MDVTTNVIAGVLTLTFLASGIAKVLGARQMVDTLERHLGVSSQLRRLIGALEIAAAAAITGAVVGGLRALGVAAAVGLVLLMFGAVGYHARAGDGPQGFGPPAVLGVLAAVLAALLATVRS